MKKFIKNPILTVLAVYLVLGTTGPIAAFAATTPFLNTAATYAVLAGTYTNTWAATTITGDIGFTTAPATPPLGVHTNYGPGATTATARTNAADALTSLASQQCTFTFAAGPIDLSTDITHDGPVGVYSPGVYCSAGAMNIGGALTLNGSGTYIFRPVGALTSTANSIVTLSGASECDVFWTPTAATTLGATTTFFGTIIDNAHAITVGANTAWTGRALSLGAGTVTTGNTVTITAPTCAASAGGSGNYPGSINVVKLVINDNGGTKTIADFPLFIDGTSVTSGVTNNFSASTEPGVMDEHVVTETSNSNYTQSFSGDCDSNGVVLLHSAENRFCIITNDDIGTPVIVPPVPPIIDVVKVPDPLALPDGPGEVDYSYTLTNIGTVPVTDITMVGDSCEPITLTSGDLNSNSKLEVSETWIYNCSRTLTETHTNTVVATGWANGLSATDIASATVVVGEPVVPPLIHVTKIPDPLTLLVGGGMVTYIERVTNPGTVALSNVKLTDDKCSPMKYVYGDTNKDSKLDTTESWKYICYSTLTKTTTNTAIASGEANGITVKDLAIATVPVATAKLVVPKLPNTGFSPEEKSISGSIIMLAGILILISTSLVGILRKQ